MTETPAPMARVGVRASSASALKSLASEPVAGGSFILVSPNVALTGAPLAAHPG